MTLLLDEYRRLLDKTISKIKSDYPEFIIYTATIVTEESNNISYISFDDKENSLKKLEKWREEYDYWINTP